MKISKNARRQNHIKIFVYVALFCLLFSKNSLAFENGKYIPSDIDATVLNNTKSLSDIMPKPLKGKMNQPAFYKYKFSVIYEGETRSISQDNLEGLKFFEKTYKDLNPKLSEISQHEVLIKSAKGVKYWLPIQDILIEPFKNEVKKGQVFDVYVLNPYNSLNVDGSGFSVFLISDFSAKNGD